MQFFSFFFLRLEGAPAWVITLSISMAGWVETLWPNEPFPSEKLFFFSGIPVNCSNFPQVKEIKMKFHVFRRQTAELSLLMFLVNTDVSMLTLKVAWWSKQGILSSCKSFGAFSVMTRWKIKLKILLHILSISDKFIGTDRIWPTLISVSVENGLRKKAVPEPRIQG